MAATFGRNNGPEESTITTQSRASARWLPFENNAELRGFRAQSSDLSHSHSPEESWISPVQVYEQTFVLAEFDATTEVSWSIPSSSPVSPFYPWGWAHETISPLALLPGSDSSRQTDGHWDPPIHPGNVFMAHEPHYLDWITDGTSETQPGVNMPNMIDSAHETDIFLRSPNPLPDSAFSQGNKDPWSLPGSHPTSHPHLVHCHPV